MSKRWRFREFDTKQALGLSKEIKAPSLLARLLAARGYLDPARAGHFLKAGEGNLHSPGLLSGMDKAVARAKQAVQRGEKIVIYGDYDVDGVTSTALLMKLFSLLGNKASFYIPDRLKEGYGLNSGALQRLKDDGAALVITVDNGISAVAEAKVASEIALDLIITDHHVPGPELPGCLALINPKTSPDYPYDMLGGVGVAYKFAEALLEDLKEPRKEEFLDHMLELVALGTVCDVAPLDGENRDLVARGIQRLKLDRWLGIRSLCLAAGLRPSAIDAGAIGFVLGPRLNAGGRIGEAAMGVRLLLSKEVAESRELAAKLDAENKRRQGIEKEVLAEAMQQAEERIKAGDKALVLWNAGWHPGVVGLAASRILEKFSRPTLVLSVSEGLAKGSGRCRRPFHLVDALNTCADLIKKYGGHEFAAGLTIEEGNLPQLRERMNQAAAKLSEEDFQPSIDIDCWCDLSEVDSRLMDWLGKLEPFGLKNPRPVFAAASCNLLPGTRVVGSTGEHLKLSLRQGPKSMNGIAFRQASVLTEIPLGDSVDIAFSPSWNEFNGSRTLQLDVKDIRPCASPAGVTAGA